MIFLGGILCIFYAYVMGIVDVFGFVMSKWHRFGCNALWCITGYDVFFDDHEYFVKKAIQNIWLS